MRNFIITAILVLTVPFFNSLNAQPSDNMIVIGTIDSLHSKILNEQRKIMVYVPNSTPSDFYSKQRYPVVYLLDGNAHFFSMAGIVNQLSMNSVCPEMIIVGIPNTNRWRDLTPTKPNGDMPFPPGTGGGAAFTSFLEKELIPYIDSTYPTAPYRMMIGHSLGGLMVINTLLHHHNMFNSYLSIDPSLWWDDELFIKQADSVFSTGKFQGKSLFLAMANNNLPKSIDFTTVLNDTSDETANARPMLSFTHVLDSKDNHALRWKFKYYPDDTHNSVPLISEYDALRYFFDEYNVPVSLNYEIREPSFKADSAIIAHFHSASAQMGYTVLPPERFVNENAYAMMQNNDMDRAFRLFDLNIRNYPDSYNVYDSMGDYYMAKKDKTNAILFFEKALKLKEIPAIRNKLTKLKSE